MSPEGKLAYVGWPFVFAAGIAFLCGVGKAFIIALAAIGAVVIAVSAIARIENNHLDDEAS